jgi:hypothetical protein
MFSLFSSSCGPLMGKTEFTLSTVTSIVKSFEQNLYVLLQLMCIPEDFRIKLMETTRLIRRVIVCILRLFCLSDEIM